jgi:hypothetical protein
MARRSFPDSRLVSLDGLDFELVREGAAKHVDCLGALRDEVLQLAAEVRGWTDPESLSFFRKHFKIEPLYAANALLLIYQEGALVGLAGSVNNWTFKRSAIVHLCTLGLKPAVQMRGLLDLAGALLWLATLRQEPVRKSLTEGRLFATAITQSPYIMAYMLRFADIVPSPSRAWPTADELNIARLVAARFDRHIPLDEARLILRNECNFRYRRVPLSRDRALNRFCLSALRYEEGDVFVVVGRVNSVKLERFVAGQNATNQRRLARLWQALGEDMLPFAPPRAAEPQEWAMT